MANLKKYGKIILFDALAVFCFIGVILFGWLPGPGGIPLFLAGLALLAINHEWAERYLEKFKNKALNFKKLLFPNKPWVKQAYDFTSVTLIAVAILIFTTVTNKIVKTSSVAILCLGIVIFLTNRDRLDKLSKKMKK